MQIIYIEEIEKFFNSLEKRTLAKVLRTIDLLERFGNRLGMPHSKKVSESIYELRIRGEQEVRIFYSFHAEAIYLLTGFIKKSQKIPLKELVKAKAIYKSLT
jgi:hypothetical protein